MSEIDVDGAGMLTSGDCFRRSSNLVRYPDPLERKMLSQAKKGSI
jgi:hypothetical protein